jgi:hypothetical protein
VIDFKDGKISFSASAITDCASSCSDMVASYFIGVVWKKKIVKRIQASCCVSSAKFHFM